MPNKSKPEAYRRRRRRSCMFAARKLNLIHSCGSCQFEEDDVCTLHENVPAFEVTESGLSTMYFGICEDWIPKPTSEHFDDITLELGDYINVSEDYTY